MILNGECRWEYIGNQRIRIPPDQPQGWLRILTNPCRHSENFATNAGKTTFDPLVAGSSPALDLKRSG
jgi:hypothetical protein